MLRAFPNYFQRQLKQRTGLPTQGTPHNRMFSKEFFRNLELSAPYAHPCRFDSHRNSCQKGINNMLRCAINSFSGSRLVCSLFWYCQELNSHPGKWRWISKTFVDFPEEMPWSHGPAQCLLLPGILTLTNKRVLFLGMCYNPVPFCHFMWQAQVKS